jgi:sugar lactone lactonase YvrE
LDSIALDRRGEWLYYGAVDSSSLWRVRTADVNNPELTGEQLSQRVEHFSSKPQSGGLSSDDAGNLYVTDLQRSTIDVLDPQGELHTLAADPKMRWPDGLSFGPNGDLYVADSDLPDIFLKPPWKKHQGAPYFIYRVATGQTATPGQ